MAEVKSIVKSRTRSKTFFLDVEVKQKKKIKNKGKARGLLWSNKLLEIIYGLELVVDN